jgi:hypothetical protein
VVLCQGTPGLCLVGGFESGLLTIGQFYANLNDILENGSSKHASIVFMLIWIIVFDSEKVI